LLLLQRLVHVAACWLPDRALDVCACCCSQCLLTVLTLLLLQLLLLLLPALSA
jgi:hypothetical protein